MIDGVQVRPMLVSADLDWPVPEGWRAEPVGDWQGRPVVAIYDPGRHEIMIARGGLPERQWELFRGMGYELQGVDGNDELWVRDRLEVAYQRLARTDVDLAQRADLAAEMTRDRGLEL